MTARLIFDSLISLIICSLPHNSAANNEKKHQIRGSEGLFSCVSLYPIYFRTAAVFSFSLVWPLWNAEWAWGDKHQALAFWSLGRQNKSVPGWPELLPHLPRTLKISLLLNPFISSQKVTFVVQLNHSKWRKKPGQMRCLKLCSAIKNPSWLHALISKIASICSTRV